MECLDDITDPLFVKQTGPTKRTLGHDELEEVILRMAKVLSAVRLTHIFDVSE
jgi:hypothetical protein